MESGEEVEALMSSQGGGNQPIIFHQSRARIFGKPTAEKCSTLAHMETLREPTHNTISLHITNLARCLLSSRLYVISHLRHVNCLFRNADCDSHRSSSMAKATFLVVSPVSSLNNFLTVKKWLLFEVKPLISLESSFAQSVRLSDIYNRHHNWPMLMELLYSEVFGFHAQGYSIQPN
jgi:hypothetical protein